MRALSLVGRRRRGHREVVARVHDRRAHGGHLSYLGTNGHPRDRHHLCAADDGSGGGDDGGGGGGGGEEEEEEMEEE